MIFTQEFLNNMNYKARLIHKLEATRFNNAQQYLTLAREHNIKPSKFNTLPVKELREIVGVLEGDK